MARKNKRTKRNDDADPKPKNQPVPAVLKIREREVDAVCPSCGRRHTVFAITSKKEIGKMCPKCDYEYHMHVA